ncbi:uncharacterized protein LOC127007680 [Eriocheir sinensis]|uniref:uncharacterized protein LOC127007680 n=1 Tax=Eriocheir sinensis TaxID=95602 RepID=UPI0021C93C3E|nr:uncharacterized protein LOC127007680 [Eriocheir sinensis]
MYRLINKHIMEGGSFDWTYPERPTAHRSQEECLECPYSGAADSRSTPDRSQDEYFESTIGGALSIASEQCMEDYDNIGRSSALDADCSFTVELPNDPVISVHEKSIENKPLSKENLTDNQPVTWEVVPGGTKRGKPRLHSSDGHTYTIRKGTESVTYWTCSIRQKDNKCRASVVQRGVTFKPGQHTHSHPATPGLLAATTVSVAVKKRCAQDYFTSATQIVEEELATYKHDHPNAHQLPKQSSLIKQGNRHRQSQRPHHPSHLDFELVSDSLPPDFIQTDIKIGDNGNQNSSRHITMATKNQFSLLSNTKQWYIDGTFKIVRNGTYMPSLKQNMQSKCPSCLF